jgi:hypothetical protein
MQRNLPHTLPDDLVRTWNAGLASSKATVSRVGSELLRQSTAARQRFDALPSPTRTALLSCIFGGVGQISIGQKKKGAVIICLAVLGLPLVVPTFVIIVLGVYDAYVIEHEKAQTTTRQFEPTVTKSSMVKRSVENTYREKYSYSESRMQMLEESVSIEVPPHASALVELRWKHILDNWILVVGNDLGEEVRVPVHVVTKLSFDQRIIDADGSAASIA